MSLILEALRKSEAERRRGLPPDLHAELPPAQGRRRRWHPAVPWVAGTLVACLLAGAWLAREPAPPTRSAPVPQAEAPVPTSAGRADTALPASTQAVPRAAAPVPGPSPAAAVQATPGPVVAAADNATEPAAPVAARVVPAPAEAAALSLSELDPAARDALPPLRMSMHLWNEVPALRFAIIDGQRVSEGGMVGEVRVARIERDGVVLEWQGRSIRLPVR